MSTREQNIREEIIRNFANAILSSRQQLTAGDRRK